MAALVGFAIRPLEHCAGRRVLHDAGGRWIPCSDGAIASARRSDDPTMRRNGYGKVINIASGAAIKGLPNLLHYVASKGAVISMTRAMARELDGDGIRVNCIAPGLTMSENTRNNADWSGATYAANLVSRAIRRDALPEDLLGALLFLASTDSDFMTGQTLAVDGGSVMI
ncbi:MAG TPA: SDR family oxidoreductase [Rhodoblastus sp.]|nr:SDR family oxidoreductase [Rhodoblastus sp.]